MSLNSDEVFNNRNQKKKNYLNLILAISHTFYLNVFKVALLPNMTTEYQTMIYVKVLWCYEFIWNNETALLQQIQAFMKCTLCTYLTNI